MKQTIHIHKHTSEKLSVRLLPTGSVEIDFALGGNNFPDVELLLHGVTPQDLFDVLRPLASPQLTLPGASS